MAAVEDHRDVVCLLREFPLQEAQLLGEQAADAAVGPVVEVGGHDELQPLGQRRVLGGQGVALTAAVTGVVDDRRVGGTAVLDQPAVPGEDLVGGGVLADAGHGSEPERRERVVKHLHVGVHPGQAAGLAPDQQRSLHHPRPPGFIFRCGRTGPTRGVAAGACRAPAGGRTSRWVRRPPAVVFLFNTNGKIIVTDRRTSSLSGALPATKQTHQGFVASAAAGC